MPRTGSSAHASGGGSRRCLNSLGFSQFRDEGSYVDYDKSDGGIERVDKDVGSSSACDLIVDDENRGTWSRKGGRLSVASG
jgi:hypothetical protein